jgi:ferritin
MLIPVKVEKALNAHLGLEMSAVYHYLSVASWCETKGFEGSAAFFYKQYKNILSQSAYYLYIVDPQLSPYILGIEGKNERKI